MHNYWTIVWYTFKKHAAKKGFFISTAVSILLIVAVINIDKIINLFNDQEQAPVAVIDESQNNLFMKLSTQVSMIDNEIKLTNFTGTESEAKKAVEDGDLAGYLHLFKDENGMPKGTFYIEGSNDYSLAASVENALQNVKEEEALQSLGISAQQYSSVESPVSFETKTILASAKSEEAQEQTRWLVYVLLFVLYFSFILYGNMIATEVATEKSSRVIELLISSVSPVTQMFAKITGIALLGIVQLGLMGGVSGLTILYRVKSSGEESLPALFQMLGLTNIPVETIVYAVIFFFLGYLLYATLAATLGCLVSRAEETNQAIMPINYLLMIGFFISAFGLGTPEAMYVTVSSYIPPFTPIIMFLRVGMTNVATWELVTAIVLLAVTILLCAMFGARVYRGGVFMYGSSGTLKNLRKALVFSNKS
ncbi:ABC transporter permease [Metabacillus arenae]|uniref:ABC transporter permease n=1 Tax=Metabacillus arenae TaxID=2771434 RepID=A0A926NFJ8_9BACI|nr:ABC transporter permease [Metabacillus arenae]MBD1380634.1 ABC transporter permease [Metabacillus arenae]